MKKALVLVLAGLGLSSLTGCYSSVAFAPQGAPMGFLYAGTQGSKTATGNPVGAKKGEACAMSILGLITIGDASTATAAKEAGISKIGVVDTDSMNILGIYAKHCSVVTGD